MKFLFTIQLNNNLKQFLFPHHINNLFQKVFNLVWMLEFTPLNLTMMKIT